MSRDPSLPGAAGQACLEPNVLSLRAELEIEKMVRPIFLLNTFRLISKQFKKG